MFSQSITCSEFQSGSSHCTSCDKNCLTCAGPGPDNCTSCTADLVLLHKQCLQQCPQGYYVHKQQCHPCHMSCADCFGKYSQYHKCSIALLSND